MDPPKRERKRHLLNYNDAEYYKNAMKAGAKGDPRGPRLPKMPVLQDFQFYNVSLIVLPYCRQTIAN